MISQNFRACGGLHAPRCHFTQSPIILEHRDLLSQHFGHLINVAPHLKNATRDLINVGRHLITADAALFDLLHL